MARTFIAFDPRSRKREVIVEVRPDLEVAPDAEKKKFMRRLYERRVHSGLLITSAWAYFFRDSLTTLEFSPKSYECEELPASVLFGRTDAGRVDAGDGLYRQVRSWLDAVAGSWSTYVPDEALPVMLPEMVGRLALTDLEEWDDVLDPGD